MTYEQITYAVSDCIGTITLNRPEARNGFTTQMADELAAAIRTAGKDDGVRVVVLAGAGENFCVGADLAGAELEVPDAASNSGKWTEPASRVTRPMFELEKPLIAAVRGAAIGVGSTMILPADFRVASTDSRFGFVFSRRGIYPEGASTWFLPRIVGLGHAADWMISGRIIAVDEALRCGLVSEIHAPEDVLTRAQELARELVARTAPVSIAVIRRALLHMSGQASPEAAFDLDSQLIASCYTNSDAKEGITSFMEKRPPAFNGTVNEDQPAFLPWHSAD